MNAEVTRLTERETKHYRVEESGGNLDEDSGRMVGMILALDGKR